MPRDLPRLLITSGEPAGVGPDLILQLALREIPAQLVVLADAGVLVHRAAQLGLNVAMRIVQRISDTASAIPDFEIPMHHAGTLNVCDLPCAAPVQAGVLDARNAAHVLAQLRCASDFALAQRCEAIVTAPAHKGVINDAGFAFTGHTEFFAERAQCEVVMMLLAERLRVALVTTHLPLNRVSQAITTEAVTRCLQTLHAELQSKFGLNHPRIAVLGLNPHAGESGHLGHEEIDTIIPVVERMRASGMDLLGPLPADTAFTPRVLDAVDAVLAMYHDQGLPTLKYAGFGNAVNITLGLPYVRTSVDHGTALDLAGSGKADAGSLLQALALALELTSTQGARKASPHE